MRVRRTTAGDLEPRPLEEQCVETRDGRFADGAAGTQVVEPLARLLVEIRWQGWVSAGPSTPRRRA
jgi:hypothetical protein